MPEVGPYGSAATSYWRAGWANPIPVKGKWPPPPGYTGYDGVNVSHPVMQAWITGDEGGQNIALRLPGDVVGIDVDAHDGKAGADSLAAAEAELGELPATARSTSRAPFEDSGIRFYRVPPGANLRGAEKRFRARFGEHVDIIRRDHRYAVVWPSVHPETGGVYTWYDAHDAADVGIPAPPDLAELPEAWVEFLTAPVEPERPTESQSEPRSGVSLDNPWDLPRQFTRAQAIEFIRPHFEALRSARVGTINNRLNDAAVVLAHFVPAFWTQAEATRYLLDAVSATAYDGRTWRAESTIASGLSAKTWKAELIEEGAGPPGESEAGRVVDLAPFLDGTFTPPEPSIGGERDDDVRLLYPGRWHTVIGLTAAGKSWFALWHVVEAMRAGQTVVYAHFEEGLPIGTLSRLSGMACSPELIREQFIWLDCSRRWLPGEFGATVEKITKEKVISLVVLDGINAACAIHGWPVDKTEAVGAYRAAFVTPAALAGAAVLSLGHPPKARDRQGERHGFGSTGWLDEVDGVGFRLEASKTPIGRGREGSSHLSSVKDRYGQVEARGRLDTKREAGWYYQGSFIVDDSPGRQNTVIRLSQPGPVDPKESGDAIDVLAADVVRVLKALDDRAYGSNRKLLDLLRAAGVTCSDSDLPAALIRLERAGKLERGPDPGPRKPWPGRLTTAASDLEEDD